MRRSGRVKHLQGYPLTGCHNGAGTSTDTTIAMATCNEKTAPCNVVTAQTQDGEVHAV